ncbi:PREDICTED: uncharacterized protein LOC108365202 [Rhagoletis zephyria]|uniref:uncharacterized protein LOC108365202 n=1 Tax=Rhagoletis zephyria TaxID=28612 RepID=UPI0008113EC3|nr:PREDICTED: uncharacterized protein LOC108365202 [Rhagoletis zephyria]
MNKHFLKKFGAQNRSTSMAAIPAKKAKYANKTINPGTSGISHVNECTIESRRISISTSTIGYNPELTEGVLEVVCCSHCNLFEKQLETIDEKLDQLLLTVERQNTAIMDAIASQKVVTQQLVRQETQNVPVAKYFPVCDIAEMEELEAKISSANKDVYESVIASILCNNMKNISLVLKTDVIVALNLDGSHGKIGLKKFPNFYTVLTGAVAKLPFKGSTPEEMLRKAIHFEKAKYFKKLYREKQKNKEN